MRRFTHQCPELRALHASLRQITTRRTPFVSIRAGARQMHATPLARYADKPQAQAPAPANLSELDMLGNTPAPSTSIDVCMYDGFGLNSGITINGGDGALLVNGEAFAWRPWEIKGEKRMVNDKGQFDIPKESLSIFSMLWPRPGKPSFALGGLVCSGHSVLIEDDTRPAHYRRRKDDSTAEPGDEKSHLGARYACRGAGYKERGLAVQHAGYGAWRR